MEIIHSSGLESRDRPFRDLQEGVSSVLAQLVHHVTSYLVSRMLVAHDLFASCQFKNPQVFLKSPGVDIYG